MLKRILAGVVLAVMLTGGAAAAPFEDGAATHGNTHRQDRRQSSVVPSLLGKHVIRHTHLPPLSLQVAGSRGLPHNNLILQRCEAHDG